MSWRIRMFRLLCAVVVFAPIRMFAEPMQRTTSVTHQFIIFGADSSVRGEVCELAEQVKTKLLHALNASDQWAVPVLVNLQPRQSNLPEIPPSSIYVSQTGGGLKIQLNLLLTDDPARPSWARELLRGVLLEIAYRDKPDVSPGTELVLPPDWLVDGLLMIDMAPPFSILADSASTCLPLQIVLRQTAALLDSQSRLVYAVCAGELVRVLLRQEGGSHRLMQYIADLPGASADPIANLSAHFGSLGGTPQAFERNVAEAVHRLVEEQDWSFLSIEATSLEIDKCLQSRIASDGKSAFTFGQAGTISPKLIDRKAAHSIAERFGLMSARAHPALRPVISEYQQVAELLARGNKGIAKRLGDAAMTKIRIGVRMESIEDFLNWFEATQATHPSGAFANYSRTVDQSNNSSRRRDAVSVYLDSMDSQFH